MIIISGVSLTAGAFRLQSVSFEIPASKYAVLMGKTGSGKTTLLESLCGLRPLDCGRIVVAGVDVTKHRPAERGIGYVPQDGALFPHMTVRNHLAFPLVIRNWSKNDMDSRINELAELMEITPLLDRFPARLSGGEIQRVALGRALSFKPRVLLLDEPLSALDDETRSKMYSVLKEMQSKTGVTTLHVTHNQDEMEQLADLRLQLRAGKVDTQELQEKIPGLPPEVESASK